jgi:hypothetical protein
MRDAIDRAAVQQLRGNPADHAAAAALGAERVLRCSDIGLLEAADLASCCGAAGKRSCAITFSWRRPERRDIESRKLPTSARTTHVARVASTARNGPNALPRGVRRRAQLPQPMHSPERTISGADEIRASSAHSG